jgi:hypothetical protein
MTEQNPEQGTETPEPQPEPQPEPLTFDPPKFDYVEKGDNHEGVETRGSDGEHK